MKESAKSLQLSGFQVIIKTQFSPRPWGCFYINRGCKQLLQIFPTTVGVFKNRPSFGMGDLTRVLMVDLVFPFPPRELSPNGRCHWAKKARVAKDYRATAYILCRKAAIALPETTGKLHLWIDFYPPDKRVRDADNLLASGKSLIDGLAEYYRVNDSRFIFHPWLKDEVIKDGCVKVRITAGPECQS